MESLTFTNFNKGITDSYISASPEYSSVLNNFLIDESGNLNTRSGWQAFLTRMTFSLNSNRPSGIYLGSNPFNNPVYFRADRAFFLNESDAWTEIVGPASNVAAPNKTTSDFESLVVWNKQLIYASNPSTVLPHRIYCTAFSGTRAYTALTLGLPALSVAPSYKAQNPGTGYTYIYAFHYYYEFTDSDSNLFIERGPVTRITAVAAAAITGSAGNRINIGDHLITPVLIPTLTNTASTNYVVSTAMKIKVFRTANNGNTLYYLTDLTNGTTGYDDRNTDAQISVLGVIYTDGRILEYKQPPIGAKFVTQVNNYFWYATERSVTHSIQGSPGACPSEYIQPIDQAAKGLASTISFPVLFCDQSIYRIDGFFDGFGDGGFDLREIHPSAGCVANRSIVRITGGLVWAGTGGFYFTDGQQVIKISKTLDDRTYKIFRNTSITGAFDSINNIVYWTVSSGKASNFSTCDRIAALHLNYGISDRSVFTTLNSENNIFPNCLAFSASDDVRDAFRNKLLIGDAHGYLVVQNPAFFSDHLIDTNTTVDNFNLKTIIYRYESVALDLGTDATRKYCEQLSCILIQQTETSVQFLSRRDDGGIWSTFSEVRVDGAITWNLTDLAWNDASDTRDPKWNSLTIVDGMRHFQYGTLRSLRRQIGLTNSKTWIANSDTSGLATTSIVNSPTIISYVDLNNALKKWPNDCQDYEILFSSDAYTQAYTIKTRISDTRIQIINPLGILVVTPTAAWQIRGYRKNERITLESFTVHFAEDSQTMTPSLGQAALINA